MYEFGVHEHVIGSMDANDGSTSSCCWAVIVDGREDRVAAAAAVAMWNVFIVVGLVLLCFLCNYCYRLLSMLCIDTDVQCGKLS